MVENFFSTADEPAPLLCLQDFSADVDLALPEFIKRHTAWFLVHHGPIGVLKEALRPQQTVLVESEAHYGSRLPRADFVVFPIKKSTRGHFSNFISLGRSKTNDIIINDVSISKIHAIFLPSDERLIRLQDAGSRNGTFIEEQAVPQHGRGPARALDSGVRLRFGNVGMTFMLAEQLRAFAKRMLPVS